MFALFSIRCPPCRGFTPVLAKLHKQISATKPFEIVFVSSDRDEGSFNEYYGEMPWMALPFEDRERKAKLSSKFKVQGIPTLVIVDENGKTITTDGRAAITGNPAGFPWAPKPFKDLLGTTLRKSDGTVVPTASLGNKNLVLYFSAHWCPPCRQTTPLLAKLYQSMRIHRADDFEFIFISSDKDMKSFSEYHGEMPWLAMPFDKRAEKEELSNRYGVEGIPSLIVVDPEGNVINKVCSFHHTQCSLLLVLSLSLACNCWLILYVHLFIF
jgi:nucleoredoxin